MANPIKEKRKTVLCVLICAIIAVNVCVVLATKASWFLHRSAEEILGKDVVDSVSFCVDGDFFKDSPVYIPENIVKASEDKFSYFLLEAYRTSDGEVVCVPEENLENVIGIEGNVGDHTYFDLLKYNLVYKKEPTSTPIMLCRNLVEQCVSSSLIPVIEPNGFDSYEQMDDILKAYEFSDLIVVMTDDFDMICKLNEKYPSIKLWYKVNEATDEIIENMAVVENVDIVFNAQNRKNNSETIEKIKAQGLTCGCFDVNKNSLLKKYASLGVSEMITSRYVKTK
ncbi:MAG: hypothetical protein IJU39_02740 [Clostridia bacterium]|nr:hypothetical protein [Clostridia bacterium]